jgi:hypothetical protein
MSTLCYFSIKINWFIYFDPKIRFVLFCFRSFLAVIERNRSYFAFDLCDVRIKQKFSFRYRNELKIRPKQQIGFMHVDITTPQLLCLRVVAVPRLGIKTRQLLKGWKSIKSSGMNNSPLFLNSSGKCKS